jgi:vacuolar-type H+-ATPase subunit I/STV1
MGIFALGYFFVISIAIYLWIAILLFLVFWVGKKKKIQPLRPIIMTSILVCIHYVSYLLYLSLEDYGYNDTRNFMFISILFGFIPVFFAYYLKCKRIWVEKIQEN